MHGLHQTPGTGVAIVGVNDHLYWADDLFASALGFSTAEIAGRTLQSLTFEEDQPLGTRLAKRLNEGACEKFEIEKRMKHRSGTVISVELGALAIRDKAGKVVYAMLKLNRLAGVFESSENSKIAMTPEEAELERIRRAVLGG